MAVQLFKQDFNKFETYCTALNQIYLQLYFDPLTFRSFSQRSQNQIHRGGCIEKLHIVFDFKYEDELHWQVSRNSKKKISSLKTISLASFRVLFFLGYRCKL